MQSVQTTHFVRYLVFSDNLVQDTEAYKNLAVHPGNEGPHSNIHGQICNKWNQRTVAAMVAKVGDSTDPVVIFKSKISTTELTSSYE